MIDSPKIDINIAIEHGLNQDEFDEIDWAYIDRLRMQYFDNKIFITVPLI